jgi:phage tail-like protein
MVRRFFVVALAFVVTTPGLFAQTAITAARFSLTIDGFEIASFTELGSIAVEGEDLREFGTSSRGRGVVTLSRRATNNLELWAWHEAVVAGLPAARKNASLVGYNRRGEPVQRYHLENAWPAKIEISGLKSGASEVLMETVTIVSERMQRVVN